MFIPVACSQCGKPFQVPESIVGSATVCPWCQATVTALPVGKPVATPASVPAAPAAEPLPPLPLPLPEEDDVPLVFVAPDRKVPWKRVAIVLGAVLAVALVTFATLRSVREQAKVLIWKSFTPEESAFEIELFGTVNEAREEGGVRRVIADKPASNATAWVGWIDLTPAQVEMAAHVDAWKHFTPIFDAERERILAKHEAKLIQEATTKFANPLTRELRAESPRGYMMERMMVFPKGAKPRAYFVGMIGPFEPDGPEFSRLFDSFRVKE